MSAILAHRRAGRHGTHESRGRYENSRTPHTGHWVFQLAIWNNF
jgi:hypothetical protein